jgi:hypothetical protein
MITENISHVILKTSVPTIILTATVNVHNVTFIFQTDPKSRIACYLKSIKKWLYETNLNIVLVENSGYLFEELNLEKKKFNHRFEIISFDEKKIPEAKYLEKSKFGKGRHELFAINYAYNCSKLLKIANFIIKITARFYISEFESFLSCHNLNDYDCLVQYDEYRCEIVGSHIKNFIKIFDLDNINIEHIEETYRRRAVCYSNVLRCKIFNIEETQRGGMNETFKSL